MDAHRHMDRVRKWRMLVSQVQDTLGAMQAVLRRPLCRNLQLKAYTPLSEFLSATCREWVRLTPALAIYRYGVQQQSMARPTGPMGYPQPQQPSAQAQGMPGHGSQIPTQFGFQQQGQQVRAGGPIQMGAQAQQFFHQQPPPGTLYGPPVQAASPAAFSAPSPAFSQGNAVPQSPYSTVVTPRTNTVALADSPAGSITAPSPAPAPTPKKKGRPTKKMIAEREAAERAAKAEAEKKAQEQEQQKKLAELNVRELRVWGWLWRN